MKSKKLWLIPGIFFLIACAVNLYGCLQNNLTVERYVKGALMPLLALTGICYLAPKKFDGKTAATLVLAQCLGWGGDSLLMGNGFAWFASGIGVFLLGHLCYIRIFSRTLKGLRPVVWILAVFVMAAILVSMVLAIGINGALLAPMLIYGAALLMITFCGLCGLCRRQAPSPAVWWMVFAGGLLFILSDGLIAMRTFGLAQFELRGFVIMSTYLVAQSLLCAAAVRLAIIQE
ncbi:MAG: lysoplasmalogenase [Bacteroidales bacterium]|nr:lysoplasmalogenase [Bacteroidales bacterium]